jgi:hypothetical protein
MIALIFLLTAPGYAAGPTYDSREITTHGHLLKIGKWMIGPDGTDAHWLGEIYRGKKLREPINIIIADPFATSSGEAIRRLVEACAKAGYEYRFGHSSGYFGFIGDQLYGQVPPKKQHAFSDGPFEFNNNHGRIFGPRLENGKYYFIAAFSREEVDPLSKVKHGFVSFNRARDDFAGLLDLRTSYKITAYLSLENAMISDKDVTTGDHDGVAIQITAEK